MATLTTSWQQVASYQFAPGTGLIINYYIDAKYSSQSTANNTTTIQTRLRSVIVQGYGSGTGYRFTLSYANTVSGSGSWTFASETITSGSSTITHNNDGTKNVTLSAYVYVGYTGLDHSFSTTVTLPKINRKANITSAPNFNDEENPTITYSNPLGNNVTSLQACISLTGSNDDIEYRDISKTGTSYTFELTNEERDILRQATTGKTRTVKFYVKTVYSGNTFHSYVDRTLTITNSNPTFTSIIQETNANAISVLGSSDATYIIKNVSQPEITVTPTALKYATISNVVITNDTQIATITTSPYQATFTATSGTFGINVIDSRGYNTNGTITKTLIDYEPVAINSFNFERQNPTSSNLILNADIKYYQKTFNQTANVPTIKYQCVEEGQDLDPNGWVTISSSDYTVDTTNNKITISNLLLNNVLEYRKKGTLYLKVNDLLTEFSKNMPVIKGIPTMDMGEHDVCINGDLYIADEDRENAINVKDIGKRVYSTTEKVVGVWMDGRPIYSMTYSFSALRGNNAYTLNPAPTNVDFMWFDLEGTFLLQTGGGTRQGMDPTSTDGAFDFSARVANGPGARVNIYVGGSVYSGSTIYATMLYTKTTD